MKNKLINRFKYFFIIIIPTILIFLLIFVFEHILRNFSDITFFGNSSNLFEKNVYSNSIGNAKNIKAVSFGSDVYTDNEGFRKGKRLSHKITNKNILIIGDSVSFGPGVNYDSTFSGLLQKRFKNYNFKNSSVIGYSINDYSNFFKFYLKEKIDDFETVLLFFCLNDLSISSSTSIKKEIELKQINLLSQETKNNQSELIKVDELKKINFIFSMNKYLRSRSMIYLYIKGIITDPQKRYWEKDFSLYNKLDQIKINRMLKPIHEISEFIRKKNKKFFIFVMPYEYQLRSMNPKFLKPQILLSKFFESNNINSYDLHNYFLNFEGDPSNLFLRFDPMHLSIKGHELVNRFIIENIKF